VAKYDRVDQGADEYIMWQNMTASVRAQMTI